MGRHRLHLDPSPGAGGGRGPQKGGPEAQGLGRSRGGLGTKIHACVDALGLPIRLILTPGHRGDVIQAAALVEGLKPAAVLADKAYDADHFHDTLRQLGAKAVIPPRPERARPHPCDWRLYKERNGVERMFSRLKQFRRVATRYDKLLSHFRGFVLIASIVLWLR